jgi:hypothetical protein
MKTARTDGKVDRSTANRPSSTRIATTLKDTHFPAALA